MGSLLSYSGLSTKIRAMESKLMNEKQYQEIAQMDSVPQIVAYLKKQPGFADLWADLDENSLHRGDLEKLLIHTIHQNFAKLYRFANPEQRTFMALYFKRYEISVMKDCLRNVFDKGKADLDLSLFQSFFDRHSKLNIEKLTNSSTIEEFVGNLQGSEYYGPLSRLGQDYTPTLFDYGMALDQYYFSNIWSVKDKLFKKRDLEEITTAYGNKFDMLNLQWIYRSKKYYHMAPADIYALLIPMRYRLSKHDITALVEASDLEEFRRALDATYYKKRFPELAPEKLEEFYNLNLKTIIEKEARNFAETFIAQNKVKLLDETKSKMSLDDLFNQIQEGNLKELNIVVKADVQGSVEALKQSLLKLSNDEVVIKIIHGGVGAINESDVILASASNAIIIGFNVRPDATAKDIADREGVDMRLYRVIYNAIEDVEAAMKGLLDPVFEEKILGHAEVRQTFKASGVGTIAGAYVQDGIFERNCSVRLIRDGIVVFDGPLASLRRFKDDVKEVRAGYECGFVFENYNDIKEGDQVEAYKMVETERK